MGYESGRAIIGLMHNTARRLIEQYMEGWKENSKETILEVLSPTCTIIESHGPTYKGVENVSGWIDLWVKEKARVLQWDITSFLYKDDERTAWYEWDFTCIVGGKKHKLLGASLVKFENEKIVFIHEYRMTKNPYEWSVDQLLQSE
jgi:hypothetical protein